MKAKPTKNSVIIIHSGKFKVKIKGKVVPMLN